MPLDRMRDKRPEQDEESDRMSIRGKNTSRARITITTAFSRIRGLVGRKLFRISPEEDWDKMNNRLKGFYEQLERDDPMIAVSLSASAYTPSLARLILIITSASNDFDQLFLKRNRYQGCLHQEIGYHQLKYVQFLFY